MAVIMTGNVIAGANRLLFTLNGNDFFSFEIGKRGATKYHLSAEIVGDGLGEPLFNGTLFLPDQQLGGIIIDNFPKAEPPQGWEKRPREDGNGYDLAHGANGQVIFGYRVNGTRCSVTTNIYNEKGEPIAVQGDNGLVVHKGPATAPPWFSLA